MEQLNEYLNHPNNTVREAAERIVALATEVKNGNLTVDEYQELAEDVADTALAADHGDDVVSAANIEHTVRMLIDIIPKVVGLVG